MTKYRPYYCSAEQYSCPFSQRLHLGKMMNIQEVAKYASRLGWEYEMLLPLFLTAYQNYGDAGVMELFHEVTGSRLDNMSRGHYIVTYYL